MPPHGPGMFGAMHSHNPEFPDDNWNLYSFLDVNRTRALNVTQPQSVLGIFKPFALRFQEEPRLVSDADAEIIIIACFTHPVSIRRIMIIGSGEPVHHPNVLRCYVNAELIDFNNITEFNPTQSFNLPVNQDGTAELTTVLQPFTNIQTVAFYIPSNHGETDETMIRYIGLQGEHTHYRREPVDAMYEVLCNGQDIQQPEEFQGSADAMLGHHKHMH